MPWKECHVVDERLRFVARRLDGEKMAALCAEFGISRKTGYKIYDRYKDCGVEGLTDRSRRPYRHANQLPMAVEKLIVRAEAGVSRLGRAQDSRAAAAALARTCSCPAISTVHAVLDRHGLVTAAAPRATAPRARRCRGPTQPNDLVVRRLQGRVHARRPPLLLPAHHHRFRQPLPAHLRGARRRRRRSTPSPSSSASSRSSGCPRRSAPTTACRSRRAHALYGLSKLVRLVVTARDSASSGSSPGIPSRTGGMSGCISR